MTPSTDRPGGPSGSGPTRPGGGRTHEGAPSRDPSAGRPRPHATSDGDSVWRDDATRPGEGADGDSVEGDDVAEAEIVSEDQAVEHDLDQLLGVTRRERDEYLDMLRRVQADFENYKKRMLRQQTDHLERAAEGLVVKLLPVLDAFDLARAHLGEGDELSPEGKALLAAAALLADTLSKEGLERIDDVGAGFDPMVHDAVEHAAGPAENGAQDAGPIVKDVLRAGYRWKGRVIRPAMVRVQG